ncbi:MAG: recombinase family protein [Bacillota bacterium]
MRGVYTVGVYVRVSTEEQALHGYSAPEQEAAGKERGRQIAPPDKQVRFEVFADLGVSGSTLDRPELARLREWVKQGRLDAVVARDPDRLSRKLAHQLLLAEEFEKAGVRLEFLDFEWKDTPEGRLFYAVKGAFAEYEREKIRERTVRGKLQKARMGGIPVSFDVYGYRYDPETGRVEVDEAQAAVVRDIFTWFVTEDTGVLGIANRLNDLGVPTRRNAPFWRRQVVRQMLSNPVFKGEWRYRGVTVAVPAIVDAATWEKAQEKLREARRLWANKGRHEYLLSGIVTCAECGTAMHGCYAKWWGRRERRYTCRKARAVAGATGCRPTKMVMADYLEAAVWEQVKAALADPDALAREAAARAPRAEELRQELDRVERRLAEVERGRAAVLDALASGLFELDARAKAKLAELKRRKDKLEARKRELEAALRGAEGAVAKLEELRAVARDVLERMDELSFAEKRALVRALVAQVVVSGRPYPRTAMRGVTVTVVLRLEEAGALAAFSRTD